MNENNKKKQAVALETIAIHIKGQRFSNALRLLNEFCHFDDKSAEEKAFIINSLDKVLRLADEIICHAFASFDERNNARQLCQIIHHARALVYIKQLSAAYDVAIHALLDITVDALEIYTEEQRIEENNQVRENIAETLNVIIKQIEKLDKKEKEKEKQKEKKAAKQKLAEELFRKGEEVFQQQHYLSAIGFYQQAVEQNVQHFNAHLKLSQSIQKCEFNAEKIVIALKSCDALISMASSIEGYKNNLALAYCEKGNVQFFLAENEVFCSKTAEHLKQAQKNFERAIKEDAALSRAYFGLAKCFMRQAASKQEELALLVEGDEFESEHVIRNDKEMMVLYEKAENNFTRGIEKLGAAAVLPADIYWELGQLKDGQGELEGGEKYYAMAFQGDGNVFCPLYLVRIQKDCNDNLYQDAVKKYTFIKDEASFYEFFAADFLATVGNAYIKLKMFEEALACYRQANIKQPNDAVIEAKITVLFALQLNNKEAQQPVTDEDFFKQGNAAFAAKQYEVALEHYKQTITLNSKHGQAYIGAAKCCRRLGEEKMQSYRFKIVPAAVGAESISQVGIIQPEDEKRLYEQSEDYFFIGLGKLADYLNVEEIYREIAYLYELKGNYRKAITYYEMAANNDKDKFYAFYRELTANDFLTKSFHLIYRLEFLLHDEGFEAYYTKNNPPVDYRSGLYHDCGYIYNCYGQFDCAVQQYLLALSCSKSASNTQIIFASLERVLQNAIDGQTEIFSSIFKNILNLTTVDEMSKIKEGYIIWMKHDLKKKDYLVAIKKFMLLGVDESSHSLMSANFLCHMGYAYAQCKDFEGALTCYNVAFDVNPVCASIEPSRTFLQKRKESLVYSSGASSPVMYQNRSNEKDAKVDANLTCNII